MNYFGYDCFRYNVLVELSPLELEEIHKDKLNPLNKHLEDSHLVDLLSKKWKLTPSLTFSSFFVEWNKKYLFSSHVSLEYQLKNYKKYFTVSKAASKASRNSCESFCEAILQLYPRNNKVLYNIHKNYVYRDNAPELISKLSVEEKCSIWRKCNSQEKLKFEDFNRVTSRIYEYHRYFLTVADIAFRRPLQFPQEVQLLSIARFLKDPSVLTDPYYLEHPNVNTKWTHEELLATNCHQLLRTFEDDNSLHITDFTLSKKSCKVFEEIGLPRGMYMTISDEYSYRWLKEHGSKYGLPICRIERVRIRSRRRLTIMVGGVDSMMTVLFKDKTCPSFYEFIREESKKYT